MLEPADTSQLTYDTDVTTSATALHTVVAGRAPAGAVRVEVATGAARADAALRDGLYIAPIDGGLPATEIVARGPNGSELARLAYPQGLYPGMLSSPSP